MSVHSRPSVLKKKSTLDKNGGSYPNSSLVDEDSDDDDSIDTLSDDLQNNNWLYSDELIRGHVTFLEKKEELFWKKLLDAYLHPVEDDKVSQIGSRPINHFSTFSLGKSGARS